MKQKQTPLQLSVPLRSMTPQRAKQSISATGLTAQSDLNVFYEDYDHDYLNFFASQSEYETENIFFWNQNSLKK